MPNMNLSREEAIEIWGDEAPFTDKIKSRTLADTTRWGEVFEVIFEHENKYWRTYFEIGFGSADYTSWDDVDELECREVAPMQVVVTQWFDVE